MDIESEEWFREKYLDEKLSIRDIGNLIGRGQKYVLNRLRKYDIEIRSPKMRSYYKIRRDWDNKEYLEDLYINQNLGANKIARLVGCSRTAIANALNRHNISIKKTGDYNKYSSIDKDKLYDLYIVQDKSINQICEVFNLSCKTISKALKHHNIYKKSKDKYWTDKKWLEEHYIDKELSASEIAKIVGCSKKNIQILLKKHNIQSRSPTDPVNINKIRKSSIDNWNNEQYRNSVIKGNRDKWSKPEYRAKMIGIFGERLKNPSKPEMMMCQILDDMGIKYYFQYPIGNYYYDFYLPDHDIIIESQSKFHESDRVPKHANRDKSKAGLIANNFPRLALKYVWEWEYYVDNRIKSLLLDWCGIEKLEEYDFNFSDISIELIDYDVANMFVARHHYAGKLGNNQLRYGAHLDDKLIALCVFGGITRKDTATRLGLVTKEVKELTRFVIHSQYHKKNFATWFLSRCIKRVDSRDLAVGSKRCKCLVSFADTTFGHDGTIYIASNWRYDGEVKPSYWYVDEHNCIMHKKTMWDRASKNSKKENEYAMERGFTKVHGKKKYRYLYWLDEDARNHYHRKLCNDTKNKL